MRRHDRRDWWLASALAVLAGYVDAVGFLRLGGMFVSFMSGNSTRLAVEMALGAAAAFTAAALIAAFVGGVVAGTTLATVAGAWRKPAVIAGAAALLVPAAALDLRGASVVLLAASMGMVNCVFQRSGEVSIGVTYMTGALVKLGQYLAAALMGYGGRWAWLPYLLLWSGLVAGAVAGAMVHARFGGAALWVAVAMGAVLAVVALSSGPHVGAADAGDVPPPPERGL